jgi:regulatory protein
MPQRPGAGDTPMPSGIITALHAQAHDAGRVNLFLDGTFALGLSLSTVAREGLFVGKALSEAEFARLERAEQAERAVRAALRYLELRPRSAAEVRQRLRRSETDPELIELALARLEALGLVDDASFARYWVESRQASRPRGPNALRGELRRKGVRREAIEAALGDAALPGDEAAAALALARGALRKYAGAPDRATFVRRLGGFLRRRGYSYEVAGPIVDRLWNELRRDEADTPPDEP